MDWVGLIDCNPYLFCVGGGRATPFSILDWGLDLDLDFAICFLLWFTALSYGWLVGLAFTFRSLPLRDVAEGRGDLSQ